ncbi:MAG: carboxynorspermidine decarboxylase [Acholeplasmataceae bacterium]|nr:carboxynorspermidine decarboxylase [Acidaminococcaceae bacterium]NLY83925.1 carboxynorspermidine decarboxylase [Acholeplasmataceae bacterium]
MELSFAIDKIPTPYFIVDEKRLIKNLEILQRVEREAGCSILLAQKAFSMFSLYPLVGRYISGTAASGLYEAKLGYEEMDKENHVFSPAYREEEFEEILELCDHIIFNSFPQWEKFRERALQTSKKFGIRINPEHSTQNHAIYDPCAPGSRLGVTRANFRPELLEGISGLHFHTLCEQNADALIETLAAVEQKFGPYFAQMEWVNFGGGHHITRADYDVEALIRAIREFREKYGVKVYLEPGEAIALNTGFLVGTVMDIIDNDVKIAVLDVSAACHMPDVLEMPYRPQVVGADLPGSKPFTYRLGTPTCLAGDVIGDYSFDKSLAIGDRIVFCDMAIYSMVKTNTFNGMKLPAIAIADINGEVRTVRTFGYEDFKNRLS